MSATATTPLVINEIYASLQGESTWAGVPMAFVRLTGCPLRCVWCDTEYAFHEGAPMALEEILSRVAGLKVKHVEVTGGEPLAQARCSELLKALCDAGYTVLLETAGSHDIAPVDPRVHVIMDLKAPGSGEEARNRWANIEHLRPAKDELKFVVDGRADYNWALKTIAEHNLGARAKAILFSPVFGKLSYQTLAQWMLEDRERLPDNVRFQLQAHKHVWDPKQRGV
ncbi:MAG: radical SAM protein [Planctomycetes bacterium]|nr:radical SAM protein [Planctomycetota bacterium]